MVGKVIWFDEEEEASAEGTHEHWLLAVFVALVSASSAAVLYGLWRLVAWIAGIAPC